MSDSSTHLPLPTLLSISSCAAFKVAGLLSSSDTAHVRVMDVLSDPVNVRTFNKKHNIYVGRLSFQNQLVMSELSSQLIVCKIF